MSETINLKERGWRLRKATAEQDGREGWLQEHPESGLKTAVYDSPGEPKKEALRLEEERARGESGGAAEADEKELLTEGEAAEGDGSGEALPEVLPSAYAEDSQPLEAPATPGAGGSLFGEVAATALRQEIHPSRITRHPLTSMRAARDEGYVLELEEVLASGRTFRDPVILFYEKAEDTHWLADGNYRTEAATRRGKMLDADVRPGGLRDAILYAAGSNVEHGRRRTNDDKRLAVVTLLLDKEWSRESDTTLAEFAGHVSQPFVGKIQSWLEKVAALAADDPDGELGDDEYVSRTGAPDGLVKIFRELPAESREALSHNVMARAETRKSADGRAFTPPRPAPADEPQLFTEEPSEGAAAAAESQTPSTTSQETPEPTAGVEGQDEGQGEKVVVNDHRRFAGELSKTPGVEAAAAAAPGYHPPGTPPPSERQSSAQPAQQPAAEKKSKRPTVKELLEEFSLKKLSVSLVWMTTVDGVSLTLNTTLDPQKAERALVGESEIGELPDALFERIRAHVGGAPAPAKPASQASGKAWETSPLNPARFKKGDKVLVRLDGRDQWAEVVGVSPEDNRKLRVKVGSKTHDYFVAQLPVEKGGSKKGTTDAKVARIIAAVEGAKNLGQLSTAEKHHKLDDLSRFSEQGAAAIRRALAARRKALGASPAKKPASKAASSKKGARAKK